LSRISAGAAVDDDAAVAAVVADHVVLDEVVVRALNDVADEVADHHPARETLGPGAKRDACTGVLDQVPLIRLGAADRVAVAEQLHARVSATESISLDAAVVRTEVQHPPDIVAGCGSRCAGSAADRARPPYVETHHVEGVSLNHRLLSDPCLRPRDHVAIPGLRAPNRVTSAHQCQLILRGLAPRIADIALGHEQLRGLAAGGTDRVGLDRVFPSIPILAHDRSAIYASASEP
jgi:hypothetical protein